MALLSVASDSRNGDWRCPRYAIASGVTNWGQIVRSHTRFVKCKFHLALNHCSCVYANAHTLLVPSMLHIDWLDPFLIEQGNHFLNLKLSFIHHWCENLLTTFCQQDSRWTSYTLSRSGWTTVLSWGPSCQFKCFLHWSTPRITSINSFSCPFSVHFLRKFNSLVRPFWFPFSALENSLMNTV